MCVCVCVCVCVMMWLYKHKYEHSSKQIYQAKMPHAHTHSPPLCLSVCLSISKIIQACIRG